MNPAKSFTKAIGPKEEWKVLDAGIFLRIERTNRASRREKYLSMSGDKMNHFQVAKAVDKFLLNVIWNFWKTKKVWEIKYYIKKRIAMLLIYHNLLVNNQTVYRTVESTNIKSP